MSAIVASTRWNLPSFLPGCLGLPVGASPMPALGFLSHPGGLPTNGLSSFSSAALVETDPKCVICKNAATTRVTPTVQRVLIRRIRSPLSGYDDQTQSPSKRHACSCVRERVRPTTSAPSFASTMLPNGQALHPVGAADLNIVRTTSQIVIAFITPRSAVTKATAPVALDTRVAHDQIATDDSDARPARRRAASATFIVAPYATAAPRSRGGDSSRRGSRERRLHGCAERHHARGDRRQPERPAGAPARRERDDARGRREERRNARLHVRSLPLQCHLGVVRTFRTVTQDLLALRDWLQQEGCTHVAMESTGVYWKPVYAILEGACELIVGNARHIKNVPGRKTDVKDSERIADLARHGLIAKSFVPPTPIRVLRDLVRYRRKLVDSCSTERNRLLKLLETCNIKLASFASN